MVADTPACHDHFGREGEPDQRLRPQYHQASTATTTPKHGGRQNDGFPHERARYRGVPESRQRGQGGACGWCAADRGKACGVTEREHDHPTGRGTPREGRRAEPTHVEAGWDADEGEGDIEPFAGDPERAPSAPTTDRTAPQPQ